MTFFHRVDEFRASHDNHAVLCDASAVYHLMKRNKCFFFLTGQQFIQYQTVERALLLP